MDNWAKPYVGYAYTNGLTTGTGKTTFGSNDPVTASQYLTFILRLLGYESETDFQWNKAWEKSDEIGLTDGRYTAESTNFTRGDVAVISNNALSIKLKNSNQILSDFIGFIANSSASKGITADYLRGIWLVSYYLKDEYNPQLGLYKSNIGLSAQYWIFDDNSFTDIYVSRVASSSPLYNNRQMWYEAGTYTIENDILKLSYDKYEGHDYNPDLTSSDLTPIQKVTKGLFNEWDISIMSDTEFTAKTEVMTLSFTKCETAPVYTAYQPLVTAFEAQLQQNAVTSLSTGLSSSERTTLDNSLSSIQNLLPGLLDNSRGIMSYLVAFSFGSGSDRLNAQRKINSYISSTASICITIQSHTSKIIEVLERKPKTATALRHFKEADRYLKQLSSITSVSNLDELNDWMSTTNTMLSCINDGLEELISVLFE